MWPQILRMRIQGNTISGTYRLGEVKRAMEQTNVLRTSNSYLPYLDMFVQFPEIVDLKARLHMRFLMRFVAAI